MKVCKVEKKLEAREAFAQQPGLLLIVNNGGDQERLRCLFERLLDDEKKESMTLIFDFSRCWCLDLSEFAVVWYRLVEPS